MRALRIDKDGATEVDAEVDEILTPEIIWTCTDLDPDHDVWVDDEGLFTPGVWLADIGRLSRIPLPAFILGHEGEASTDAKLSVEEVSSMLNIAPLAARAN